MKLNLFIYIASNFLLLHLVSLQSEITNMAIYILCVLGVLTLGIAHGSIDNILYGAKPGKSNVHFILRYLLIITLFAFLWWMLPNLAFTLFLIVSAYHFGQSQFVEYDFKPKMLSKSLFLSWGGVVLLLMLNFNGQELLTLQKSHLHFPPIFEHLIHFSSIYLIGFSSLYVLSLVVITLFNKISIQTILKETYILALVACSMYAFSAFIAFSLFFIWLHSLKAMTQEFNYCKEKLQIKNMSQFVRLFLPLTIISLLGTAIIIFGLFQFDKMHLTPYILLILLSCITIPHSFVMEKFYGFSAFKR